MTATLIAVTGTGTGIGKTHVTEALVRALGNDGRRVMGHKPIESGVDDTARGEGNDGERLRLASTFHVKHSATVLRDPVSPHLAARRQRTRIDVLRVAKELRALCDAPSLDRLVIELPGGLYSPLDPPSTNATLLAALRADAVAVVVPDRLGVLHDALALARAAHADGLALAAFVVNEPEVADASTGTNADELRGLLDPSTSVYGPLPRATAAALATSATICALATRLMLKRHDRSPT